ncbi:Protein-tyrosine phosphatase [Ancylostoma ceylanicum]|uniref:Protein-tyrosine phosphatase n=1 Tax=Ancylostoma ceylanicum TaxID=53326 RepID=A0A0D6LND3_9BILA|nr:Protein-tyrosine phosphatase [Ancylostoma ceylanicum]
MSDELGVDKTITKDEMSPPREMKKKGGFLRKAEDMLDVSLHTRIRSLWHEFRELRGYKPPHYTVEAYEKNDSKNRQQTKFRYNDILCMDATRVRLKARCENDDYIHANWITMPDNQKYICTQGPVAESVEDFWHMIFTEKSNVVVMLCNFVEGSHEKCYPYFASEPNIPVAFGKMFTVTVKECYEPDPTGTIQHKLIEVEVLGTVAKVHHIASLDWPDHTAPSSPLPAVTMLKLARMLSAGRPITVHCSAGIGRTATFVGIDYASQKIRKDGNTSMTEVLKELRHQRLHAIQSPIQYTFLHICILEMFVEEGVVAREGSVLEYYEAYDNMLKKYSKTFPVTSKHRLATT